ncbi:uncharacterized protein MKK02DRAFT_43278 [Dioszegia hungarica]|uniref:Uncharacterized protein n=1 Tax=Dioszegia hungarica TaxID=4972 RepID=A0AA38HA42_9TREE|nr:uncharacterized protein MKK02DRAFT_43278 [Dioszegia hungarica]KAI9637352.1 hypothetical protein MKK02DRAFT_43278 [Dioszegia hungarica]
MPTPTTAPIGTTAAPELPFEIVRRILKHRLDLALSFPLSPSDGRVGQTAVGDEGWEGMPGQMGKKIALARSKEREDVMRTGKELMRVCKSWKPVVQKYLYAMPPVSAITLLPFAAAVQLGDTKWDDTRLHPHSVPGRYVATLDLSTLSDGYFGPHVTSLSKACAALLPLLPNLTHLKLPGGTGWGIIPCRTILDSPFVGRLRALEGVQISDEGDEACVLLKPMRRLEVLSVLGPGSSSVGPSPLPDAVPLDLPHLHTLTLDGVQRGPLLAALIASELPNLRRLLITSYDGTVGDLTTAFLEAHGEKVLSLTFLQTREWPAIHPTPPLDTLALCPNLLDLAVLLPNPALQQKLDFARGLIGETAKHHPLVSLTLPKWLDRVSASPSASPAPTQPNFPLPHLDRLSIRTHPPSGNPFLATIISSPPPHLRRIKIDSFSWVSPKLGRAAQQAGAGGETRVWAVYMSKMGIELLDGEGRGMPAIAEDGGDDAQVGGWLVGARGRRRSSRGMGMARMLQSTGGVRRQVEEADEDGG